ncbi:transcriptional regulator [Halalkalibacter wakoensis JCM 9140]|uniref:Transcriptional regulator n=1 Tax=Halalkalibacter wakoensis JCM 9140 TaxID=1236970 RepID=W4Q143_9BACI|nr:sigma 54-interacting transcriptional regulator [Halalkalibacter wakoensis]GAE25418.1 transcriptional regulator [Halalkalibacter wakoensis JCM 9140]
MFRIGQIYIHNAFAILESDTPLKDVITTLTQNDFVIITGQKTYVIAKDESKLIALGKDFQLVGDWLNEIEWMTSAVTTLEEISEQDEIWSRPVIVREGSDFVGIVTASEWSRYLKEEKAKITSYFQTLAETVNDAVTAVDHEGAVLCWNTAAEGTYKIKREEIIGQKISEHFQTESVYLHRILTEGLPVRGAYHRPNDKTHVLINASPILYDNKIIGGVATEQDITRVVRLNEELDSQASVLVNEKEPFSFLLGGESEIQEAFHVAQKVAYADIPVLLTGEAGSGKEMFAQAIHYGGSKRNGPFVSMNCQTIPPGLFEAELFGYQNTENSSKLEQADNGTLFIEAIDRMPLEFQEKVLDYLENPSFYRVGGDERITTQTRMIASSTQPLEEMVRRGEFNESLYYRLAIITIDLPPLRNRTKDIIELVDQFVEEFSQKYQKEIPNLSQEVMDVFVHYSWPGNVKELRNVIERCIVLLDGGEISLKHLPPTLTEMHGLQEEENVSSDGQIHSGNNEAIMIEEAFVRRMGIKALQPISSVSLEERCITR